ncbi:MAG: saccharopine dehydrogenase NADP-binding domain-containing protein [Flavobacteriales bacterium]|nr:saccharopine dehydrogenase NADP-binding domain-containing protein [Flavobacteriales bacterium]
MAKRILIIGAGMSSTSLINRLLEQSEALDLYVQVNDTNLALAQRKIHGHPRGEALSFDALDKDIRRPYLQNSDLVISMLPARFHHLIIEDCIELQKDVITPSYLTAEVKALEDKINQAGILVLKEMGLDPGIDHMSAMKMVNDIRKEGGKMLRFESFTGGLIAPESDNNPWNYKFTWNPRNVVLAGQGGAARYLQEGEYKYIPYHRLFSRIKPIEIDGYGEFEGYANRDSLSYRDVYNMKHIPTIYRGTLRKKGFCEAWNAFVQMGMTDDSYEMDNVQGMTWRTFLNSFLSYLPDETVEQKIVNQLGISQEVFDKIKWLGLFEDTPIGMEKGTPAQILQKKLEEKWGLEKGDKDMIVMWHRLNYEKDGAEHEIHASMVVIGEDQDETAMAKTVGLPVAIATELIIKGVITRKGLVLPIEPDVYEPVLNELEVCGIQFSEKQLF